MKKGVYKSQKMCYNMFTNKTLEVTNMDERWDGWLVQIKTEWLNPGERQIVYVVLEDRDDRVLIQELPQYKPEFRTFLHTESVLKEMLNVIDKEIQNK